MNIFFDAWISSSVAPLLLSIIIIEYNEKCKHNNTYL
jgi:hypothetical protein